MHSTPSLTPYTLAPPSDTSKRVERVNEGVAFKNSRQRDVPRAVLVVPVVTLCPKTGADRVYGGGAWEEQAELLPMISLCRVPCRYAGVGLGKRTHSIISFASERASGPELPELSNPAGHGWTLLLTILKLNTKLFYRSATVLLNHDPTGWRNTLHVRSMWDGALFLGKPRPSRS